jgi:hypothetical protein
MAEVLEEEELVEEPVEELVEEPVAAELLEDELPKVSPSLMLRVVTVPSIGAVTSLAAAVSSACWRESLAESIWD